MTVPKIAYEDKELAGWKLDLIDKAKQIVAQFKRGGYEATLRQVYYQFVANNWFPERWADPATGSTNNEKSYKKLGDVLADARLTGRMDWTHIIDRTRERGGNQHWDSPDQIIRAVAQSYQIDKWGGQKYRPEVWVEKDAMEGVVARVARRLDIPYFSCRGYTSLTSIWDGAQHLKGLADQGYIPVVLHLGDHDPSGIDMSRDIEDRVRKFMSAPGEDRSDDLIFHRIALNMDQVRRYNPPENPAKVTDSRAAKYIEQYGESSWELDALRPEVIDRLIADKVAEYRDDEVYKERQSQEATETALLAKTSKQWDEVVGFLEDGEQNDEDEE
jgi:hypothetical protein